MNAVRVNAENYPLFAEMIDRRSPGTSSTLETMRAELENLNLYVWAAEEDGRFVGWISLVYIPKVSRWGGHGHVYVDELYVEPPYRGRGIAKALLAKADELKDTLCAVGVRLYVNVENPAAQALYERCGFRADGRAYFMEK